MIWEEKIMLTNLWSGIFDNTTVSTIGIGNFLACVLTALVVGLLLSLACSYRSRFSKSFLLTLTILPMLVAVVIMMVNGNIGAGVAVAGAFSLIRFRSNPGTAKEIAALFGAMAAGLITGMGYLAIAIFFTLIVCLVMVICERAGFLFAKKDNCFRVLTITIPESLNYSEIFDEVFGRYVNSQELVHVKTSNMGSLYKLTYEIEEKDPSSEKEMIDELRCRNGNLEISVSRQVRNVEGL